MKKNIKKVSKKVLSKEEEEIAKILLEADKNKEQTLFVDEEGELHTKDEIKQLILGDIDDPDAKHNLYYHHLQKLLKDNLLKGNQPKVKKAREIVREEINTFLTRGKRKNKSGIRGGDSRMAYLSDMEKALDVVIEWVLKNGSSIDLYNDFKKLNNAMKK